jgi:beta-aspartyl-peptidase (threonine type)
VLIIRLATSPGPSSVASTQEVQQVLDDQIAAWNRGDLEGFLATYWRSPELTFFSGKDVTHGWDATLERYRQRYQAEGKEMGRLTFRDVEVLPLTADQAWARGRWHLRMKDKELEGLFTLILRKTPDGWRIVHDHTSAGP